MRGSQVREEESELEEKIRVGWVVQVRAEE